MARVTVEDCLARIPNRFALTILASRRARALLEGKGRALVECDNKSAVTALREISSDKVRYVEDVDTVLVDFIAEQRTRLQASSGDGSYIDAAAFGMDGEDGDLAEDIEELTADVEKIAAAADDDDDDDAVADGTDAESSDDLEALDDDVDVDVDADADVDADVSA